MIKKTIVFDVDGVILNQGRVNSNVTGFIENNFEEFDFFTNTTFSKAKLQRIFEDLDIGKYFLELLAYEDGTKKENIEYVMQVHNALPENIMFIDDKQSHIDAVKDTGVHTLLFVNDGVSLEQKISEFLK